MNIIIMGPQGSGKGTQAKLLVKKLGCEYFESGDILREKAKEKSALGSEIDRVIHKEGVLLSDEIMSQVVDDWLGKINLGKGMIFDGYPRSLDQYRLLQKILAERETKIDIVFFLEVSREVSVKRLSGRRICPWCDLEYNLVTRRPKNDELCDKCKAGLIQRQDDTPAVVEARLDTYEKMTRPLVDFIRQEGILEEIDGERPVEPIFEEILERLRKAEKTPRRWPDSCLES